MNLVGEQHLQDVLHGYYLQSLVKQTESGCTDCLNDLKARYHCAIIISAVILLIH